MLQALHSPASFVLEKAQNAEYWQFVVSQGWSHMFARGEFVNGNCRIVFGVNSLGNGGSDIGEELAVSVCAG